MTDLEITLACAKAMGIELFEGNTLIPADKLMDKSRIAKSAYDPIHDDKQAMALLMLLLTSGVHVCIENSALHGSKFYGKRPIMVVKDIDVFDVETTEKFRRAICFSVAKMQAAK